MGGNPQNEDSKNSTDYKQNHPWDPGCPNGDAKDYRGKNKSGISGQSIEVIGILIKNEENQNISQNQNREKIEEKYFSVGVSLPVKYAKYPAREGKDGDGEVSKKQGHRNYAFIFYITF